MELRCSANNNSNSVCVGETAAPSTDGITVTLKRVCKNSSTPTMESTPSNPHTRCPKRKIDYGSDEERKIVRMLRSKPWISYRDDGSSSSEDDSEYEQTGRSSSLPVGVIRGCASCEGCQKVIARWKPESGRRPVLEDAPVYFPLESEFKDTVKYISSISAEAEQYGICRIVPPKSWRPPCPLKDVEKRQTAKFYTRVQRLDKLQVRKAKAKKEKRKKRRGRRLQRDGCSGRRSLLFNDSCKVPHNDLSDEDGKFGFEPGPTFTLEGFENYANQFKEEYFGLKDQCEVSTGFIGKCEPSLECIEGEYWRIVEHATEQLEVLYGADIETGVFGSGFPKAKAGTVPNSYESSGWNLNNIARLPGSVLAFEEGQISGVLEPWLYVGMCFSSFCWHVEDHHLYSLNYMHFGSPKVWYGVPGCAASKLEEAMRRHLPDLFEEQPDLLHKLVTQLSPSILKEAGVPIYRAVQRPGEFIVTFPRAYHAGFNCGFNCAEAVNVAPIDWLPHGQVAIELYKEQMRKTSISHDKLLLGAAKKYLRLSDVCDVKTDAQVAKWDDFSLRDVLVKVFKERVDVERSRRAQVEKFVHVEKMQNDFDAVHERECSVCHYDLHLSAIGCECAHEKYTCLDHVHSLCTCDKTKKYALYRHSILELETFLAALKGNINAVDNNTDHGKILKNIFEPRTMTSTSGCQNIQCNLDLSKPISNQLVQDDLISSNGLAIKAESDPAKSMECCDNKAGSFAGFVAAANERAAEKSSQQVSVEAIWSMNLDEMKAFFQIGVEDQSSSVTHAGKSMKVDPSNQGQPGASAQTMQNSHQSNRDVLSKAKRVELIVLSDDEDSQDVASSKVADSQNFHMTDLKSWTAVSAADGQCTNVRWDNASVGPPIRHNELSDRSQFHQSMGQVELSLKLQHPPMPGYFNSSFPTGADDKTVINKEWLQLGNLKSEAPAFVSDLQAQVGSNTGSLSKQREWNLVHATQVSSMARNSAQQSNHLSGQPQNGHTVDLLSVGRVVLGKAWCNKEAIFPAGFQSRVLFPSILDPSQRCYYLSEIIDGGQAGPLFKVMMVGYPSEVFMHPNIDKCWQIVQDRVNMAIELHHCLGKVGLPPIYQHGEISGYDLFGFRSPHIIKAVELLDWQHQCLEYWTARLTAVELLENQFWMAKPNASRNFQQSFEIRLPSRMGF